MGDVKRIFILFVDIISGSVTSWCVFDVPFLGCCVFNEGFRT